MLPLTLLSCVLLSEAAHVSDALHVSGLLHLRLSLVVDAVSCLACRSHFSDCVGGVPNVLGKLL